MATIPGSVRVTGFIAPTDSTDTYPVTDPIYSIDGFRSVADPTTRNAIPDARRREGMIVYTQDTDDYWTLNAGPWIGDNTDWSALNVSANAALTNASNTFTFNQIINLLSSVAITPATITGSVDDYSPGTGIFQRWSSSADYSVTGMVAGFDGEIRFVWNVGSFIVELLNEDPSSVATNRFTGTGLSSEIGPNELVVMTYSATTSRWLINKLRSDVSQGSLQVIYPGTTDAISLRMSASTTGTLAVGSSATILYVEFNGSNEFTFNSDGSLETNSTITSGTSFVGAVLSPTALSANTDDYVPGQARYYRLSATTPVDITGLQAQDDGYECIVINTSANAITLKNQSVSSTAANRFLNSTGADIVLAQDQMATLVYFTDDLRWRVK